MRHTNSHIIWHTVPCIYTRNFKHCLFEDFAISIKYEAEVAKQSALRQSKGIKMAIQQKVDMYEGLDEDARENVFMKVLMPEDSEHIDFWTFFEYMKTRTEDIENIEQ